MKLFAALLCIPFTRGCLRDVNCKGPCFSESATVVTRERGVVAMKALRVGDEVFSGYNPYTTKPKYQPVYGFGHSEAKKKWPYLHIFTDGMLSRSSPLEISGDHMLFVVDSNGSEKAVKADQVKVGDMLVQQDLEHVLPIQTKVTKILSTDKSGAYAPLTPDGTIVVNGVKASNYIDIRPQVDTSGLLFTVLYSLAGDHQLAHWSFAPYRLVCMGMMSSDYCAPKDKVVMLDWLYYAREYAELIGSRHFSIQLMFLVVPVFLLFGACVLIEGIFGGPALAPTILLLLLATGCYKYLLLRSGSKKKKV